MNKEALARQWAEQAADPRTRLAALERRLEQLEPAPAAPSEPAPPPWFIQAGEAMRRL